MRGCRRSSVARGIFAPLVLTLVCLVAAPAWAGQVIHHPLNGKPCQFAVPDGWTPATSAEGVLFTPPAGRASSVTVGIVGVANQAGAGLDPAALLKNIADGEIEKKSYLHYDPPGKQRFMGVDGAFAVLSGNPPGGGAKEAEVDLVAVHPDTIYFFQAIGSFDDINSVVNDLQLIVDGAALDGTAPAPAPQGDTHRPEPAAPVAPAWTHEAPLPAPAGTFLVKDSMLGIAIKGVPGWGVKLADTAYTLEKRLGDTKRVVVTIWLGDHPFGGDGDEYSSQVAGKNAFTWGMYAEKKALIVKRPPQFDGEGDVREYHILRKGRPMVLSFRLDGGSWDGDADAKAAQKELADHVSIDDEEPKAAAKGGKFAVPVAGGVATVAGGAPWTVTVYGPGADAHFQVGGSGDTSASVGVFTSATAPDYHCASAPGAKAKTATVLGRAAREWDCPADAHDQLVYYVPAGAYTVVLRFNDGKAKNPAAAAAQFLKFVKIP